MFDIVKSIASEDLTSKRFGNVLKELEVKYAEVNAITDLESKRAKIAEINASALERLASAAKTDADRITVELLRDAQKRALDAGASLSEAQAATEPHKALNLKQDTLLKMAQEETEQLLRSQKFELTRQQARSAAMSFVQERILTYRQAEALVISLTFMIPKTCGTVFGVLFRSPPECRRVILQQIFTMLFTRRLVQSSRILEFDLFWPGYCCRAFCLFPVACSFLCCFCSLTRHRR